MKIEKIGLVLTEAEMVELQTILFDEDEKSALEFLKQLKKRIELQQRQQCGSALVKGE
jgi:hypothetical protein